MSHWNFLNFLENLDSGIVLKSEVFFVDFIFFQRQDFSSDTFTQKLKEKGKNDPLSQLVNGKHLTQRLGFVAI